MPLTHQTAGARMLGIDAARGVAMLFSCLAHFGWWMERTHPDASGILTSVGMIATPTFLLLSGTVTGWLCSQSAANQQKTQWKLLNRGLFLVTLGHVFVSLAEAHRDGLVLAISGATIIDDIGLCMLCSALWFGALRRTEFRRALFSCGVAGYLLCWLLILVWHPPVGGWLMLHQALLGPDPLGATMHTYSSPLLPYICLFAMGVGSSDYVVAAARAAPIAHQRRALFELGCALMASAIALRGLRWLMEGEFGSAGFMPWINSLLAIGGKLPPAPAYVLLYGGAGLVISTSMFSLASSTRHLAQSLARMAAVLGRASLFVFVLQYFIFWTVPDLIGVTPDDGYLALLFIAGMGATWVAAWSWNRMGCNRLLTLGIRPPRRGPGDRITPHAGGRRLMP